MVAVVTAEVVTVVEVSAAAAGVEVSPAVDAAFLGAAVASLVEITPAREASRAVAATLAAAQWPARE
jgi:hypothetical protein